MYNTLIAYSLQRTLLVIELSSENLDIVLMQTEKTIFTYRITVPQVICWLNANFNFTFKFIVALDPLNKLYKSDGEERHEDRRITGQINRELSQKDYKWNDNYKRLDELGNLKVKTYSSRVSLLFFLCLTEFTFFRLDKLYASTRKQRFDDRNIRKQANRALYLQTDDEWDDIDSLLNELGNTFFTQTIKITISSIVIGLKTSYFYLITSQAVIGHFVIGQF